MPILPVNRPAAPPGIAIANAARARAGMGDVPAFGLAPGAGGGNANFPAPQPQAPAADPAMPVAGAAPGARELALAAGIGGVNPRPAVTPMAIGQTMGSTP